MTSEELEAEEARFHSAVNAFIERCTQTPAKIEKEEALSLHNSLQAAFGAYADALRRRGSSMENKEVGEAFSAQAAELTHAAFFRLYISLMRYHHTK